MADAAPTSQPVLEPVGAKAPAAPTAPRQRPPRSYQPLTTRLRPKPTTVVVALIALYLKSRLLRRTRLPEWVKWLVWIVGVANWRSLPGVWSATMGQVIWRAWFRYLVKGRKAVLKDVVGRSPLETSSYTGHVASFNATDFIMHLSNSSYAVALDKARMTWHIKYLGAPMRRDLEHVTFMLAASQFTFFNEVPMLASYRVETKLVAWDQKWAYFAHFFTTAPPRHSDERVLNCVGLSRIVYKLGRRTVRPARVFAIAGFGPDRSNFDRTVSLRSSVKNGGHKGVPGRKWLLADDDEDPLKVYEEQRKNNLEIVRRSIDGTNGAEALKSLLRYP